MKFHSIIGYITFLISVSVSAQTKPFLITPGYMTEPAQEVSSPEIIFKWTKPENVINFELFISKKNSDNTYSLIYSTKHKFGSLDTLFGLPKNELPEAGTYRWNVRADYKNGESIYSERLYFSLLDKNNLTSPRVLYPGKLQEPGSVIGSLSPEFIWNKSKNASGYKLVIELNKRTIFDSESLLQLVDTTMVLPDGVLNFGMNYRWKVIAFGSNGKSISSDYLYFNTSLFTKPQKPLLLMPGTDSEFNPESINSNPVFTWQRVANARGYAIYISEKLNDGNYKLIYNSEESGLIRDTTFTIDSLIFSPSSKYRWNIRAYSRAGWGDYSDRLFFSVTENDNNFPVPETLEPGSFEKSTKTGSKNTIKFLWSPVTGADGYALYLSKKTRAGNYSLIFSSERSGLIKENSYTIDAKNFNDGGDFRWNMRYKKNNIWSAYSSRRYFKIPVEKIPNSPVALNPGVLNEAGRIINTLIPAFRWSPLPNAKCYDIIVGEITNDSKFVTVYESNNIINPDNTISIPQGILKNGIKYAWKIRAEFENGKPSDYSELIYFITDVSTSQTNSLFSSFSSDEEEEIFMSFKYSDLVNETISAIYFSNEVFIPIHEVLSLLEINNEYDKNSNTINGFFLYEDDRFSIDLDNGYAELNDKRLAFNKDSVLSNGSDYFFKPDFFEKLFDINFSIYLNNLTIRTVSKNPLPVYSRNQREQNLEYMRGVEAPNFKLIYGLKKNLVSPGFLDYQLGQNTSQISAPTGNFSLSLGGELLYGEALISSRGFFRNSKLVNDKIDFRWNYNFINNKNISSVTLGSLAFDGLVYSSFNGVSITNTPLEPRRRYTTKMIYERTEPGWNVEVYLNNRIFEITRADASGNFQFELPLNYGSNLVELKFYGKNGEYYSVKKLYQTPFNFYKPSELIYKINLGKQRFTEFNIMNLEAGYGITDYMTAKLGAEYLQNSNNDKPLVFSNISTRLLESYLINFLVSPEFLYRISASATFYSQSSFDIEYSKYEKGGYVNPSNFNEQFQSNLFYPIRINNFQLNLQASFDYSKSQMANVNEFGFNLGLSASSLNPYVSYSLSKINSAGNEYKRELMDFGFSYSLYFLPEFLSFMKGNLFSARALLNIQSSKMESGGLNFSSNISDVSRIQINYDYNFINSESLIQAQLIFYLPFTQYAATVSQNNFSNNLTGSIGYANRLDKFFYSNRNQAGKKTAIFRIYIDENENGILDGHEKLLKGSKISLGTSTVEYASSGEIIARELNPFTIYNVTVFDETIKNPTIVAKHQKFSFRTGNDPFVQIDIPYYEAGEVEGIVNVIKNNSKSILPGLKLIFEEIGEADEYKTNTFNDGTFYYFGLRPGRYKIKFDSTQLEILGLKPENENIEFVVSRINNDTLNKTEIILIPKN